MRSIGQHKKLLLKHKQQIVRGSDRATEAETHLGKDHAFALFAVAVRGPAECPVGLADHSASKIGGLRDKLNRSNLTEVSFMIVNDQEAHSRAMYWELERRAPPGVPVYQQSVFQDDVWEVLDGDKDDFLVYDRCGLLTFHIVLPYSFLHYPYVEAAVRATYQKDICNCSANSTLPSGRSSSMKNESELNINHTTTLPTDPEGDKQPVTHQHIHHHHHHHHQHDHHNHHTIQENQDMSQNKTQKLHHQHHH
ncbi:unnamed protein product [Pleuronectes platessa]|uniref:Selenoprotein P N-terminal domain-containing protein n=1 Tax=Pleuronectes platessa TaxID=8262 RepID=A0A9N7THV1_PLEPL|nr:unnamed protein product [Pleuronectes platessa]